MIKTTGAIRMGLVLSVGFLGGYLFSKYQCGEGLVEEKRHLKLVLEYHSNQRQLLRELIHESEGFTLQLLSFLDDGQPIQNDTIISLFNKQLRYFKKSNRLYEGFDVIYETDSIFLHKYSPIVNMPRQSE